MLLFIVLCVGLSFQQQCSSDAQCEAIQRHAICSGGECTVFPCAEQGQRCPIEKSTCSSCPITGNCPCGRCWFGECEDGVCVAYDCNSNLQCNGPNQCGAPQICYLGNCIIRPNCTSNSECNAAVDELCVNGGCQQVGCSWSTNKCGLTTAQVAGCFSENCNEKHHCVPIACPTRSPVLGGTGPPPPANGNISNPSLFIGVIAFIILIVFITLLAHYLAVRKNRK